MSASETIASKTQKSIKWSFFAELFSKVATPISTMVLARLLAPDMYGIATSVTLIVTFCQAITDGGLGKYIIQKDFASEEDYKKASFATIVLSVFLGLFLIAIAILLRTPLASLVGASGYETVLVVSLLQLPFVSINSILSSILRRQFKFKELFYVKIIYCIAPFIITIPLAFLNMQYWSLVIGTIATAIFELPALLILTRKYLQKCFSFKLMWEIFKKSLPMILESGVIWVCSWASTFVAAKFFDQNIVGTVKVSQSTVNSIYSLFATGFTAVLFPSLSRLKNDKEGYQDVFYSLQSSCLCILLPVGIGGYCFSAFFTRIFLGSGWNDAALIIGILFLTRPINVCFNNFVSEVFRSKGHFWSSILYQLIMLGMYLGIVIGIGRGSLINYAWSSAFSELAISTVAVFVLVFRYKFSFKKQLKSLFPSLICSGVMTPLALYGSNTNSSIIVSCGQILSCASIYFASLYLFFPKTFKTCVGYLLNKGNA